MTKTKKKMLPTISRFDGESEAVYIFEKIMFRQHWTVAGRDALTTKIENIVAAEIKRQKAHREKVIEVKRFNAAMDKQGNYLKARKE